MLLTSSKSSLPTLLFPILGVLVGALTLVVVGCTGDSSSSSVQMSNPDGLVVFLAASDIALGTARIPLNILMLDGTRLDHPADRLEVTYSPPDSDESRRVSDLKWRAWPVRSGGYTATMTFDSVGLWKIKVRSIDDGLLPGWGSVLVKSATDAPDIGDPAPLTATKTTPPDGNLRSITSAPVPDESLYSISFDDAVASGLPTVISFSTPAYCQSGTCGPQTEVLSQLDDTYGDRANFIHVEIFDNPEEMLATGDPSLGVESPVIEAWGFRTEPWTFIVDGRGIVISRFEAFVTAGEIEENLLPLLEGA
ncbi:MAG: thioredoxin family protein [Dehalococcoidia bacterium]|nr:thioredoxin family protein [Dehalococcoidia bacterium]